MATGIHSGLKTRGRKVDPPQPDRFEKFKTALYPYRWFLGFAVLAVGLVLMLGGVPGGSAKVALYEFDLEPEDVVEIQRELTHAGLSFEVDPGGKQLLVTPASVDRLRLYLANQGFPRVSRPLPEADNWGAPSSERRRRHHLELAKDLERTLHLMPQVAQARVHISFGDPDRVFEPPKPKAAVHLTLRSGEELSTEEVAGVVKLVSSSVPNLIPEGVTVVDRRGQPFESKKAIEVALTDTAIRKQIESALADVVGPGRSKVVVNTEFDYSHVVVKNYDVNGHEPSGETGSQSISEDGHKNEKGEFEISTRKDATKREIDRVLLEKEIVVPRIKSRSVAVMLDGYPEHQLDKIKGFVAAAAGLDLEGRADKLAVESMPFWNPPRDVPTLIAEQPTAPAYNWSPLLALTSGSMILLVGFFMMGRRGIRVGDIETRLEALAPQQTLCDLNHPSTGPEKSEATSTSVRSQMENMCRDNPTEAAIKLRSTYLN